MDVPEPPLPVTQALHVDEGGGPALAPRVLLEPPAAEVMRAGDDAGPDRFGHPDLVHEVTDLRLHLQEIARDDAQSRRVPGAEP